MFKVQFLRNFLAIATIAKLWSVPALSQATELHPIVVAGIPVDSVATKPPNPEYPRAAINLVSAVTPWFVSRSGRRN
jgi:hypothetical protein